jgi:hypothetical protein
MTTGNFLDITNVFLFWLRLFGGEGTRHPFEGKCPEMGDVVSLRLALLDLHRELLDAQRVQAERFGGRMSASEALQAAADDLRFSWLRELSELIAALDQSRADDDTDASEAAVARARDLLDPPDPDTAFGARYLRALQDHPGVVLAHREVTAALAG